MNTLTSVLWYLDGHFGALQDRSCHIPDVFNVFHGYNQPEKSKHRRKDITNLSSATLNSFSTTLNQILLQPCFDQDRWKLMKKSVQDLAESTTKYALYLREKNLVMQDNHSASSVVQSASDCESVCILPKAVWVKPDLVAKYKTLHDALLEKNFFEPVSVPLRTCNHVFVPLSTCRFWDDY